MWIWEDAHWEHLYIYTVFQNQYYVHIALYEQLSTYNYPAHNVPHRHRALLPLFSQRTQESSQVFPWRPTKTYEWWYYSISLPMKVLTCTCTYTHRVTAIPSYSLCTHTCMCTNQNPPYSVPFLPPWPCWPTLTNPPIAIYPRTLTVCPFYHTFYM